MPDEQGGWAPGTIDTSRPSVARVYDYFLERAFIEGGVGRKP
ncbi:MAG: hypothetical protein ACRDPT_02855 [Streptomycetales bacterium]